MLSMVKSTHTEHRYYFGLIFIAQTSHNTHRCYSQTHTARVRNEKKVRIPGIRPHAARSAIPPVANNKSAENIDVQILVSRPNLLRFRADRGLRSSTSPSHGSSPYGSTPFRASELAYGQLESSNSGSSKPFDSSTPCHWRSIWEPPPSP